MSEIKMLPLPDDLIGDLYDYEDRELRYRPTRAAIHSAIQDYARAVAEHNVAARDAEIEALRAEVDVAIQTAWQQSQFREQAQARAERLAEALRGLLALPIAEKELRHLDKGIGTATRNAAWLSARAALRDHD